MRRRTVLGLAVTAAGLAAVDPVARPAAAGGSLRRTELSTRSDPGVRIAVREVLPHRATGVPVLLVHGARPGGVAAFDLPAPGGSLAADLALAGHPVYVMDVRGFGSSTYPAAMSADPSLVPPLVRSDEAVRDLAAAVELVRRRCRVERIAALGWATGGHWLGMYAAQLPDRIGSAVILNSLYSGSSPWPLQGELEDPSRPGEPRPQPGWRAVTADSLTARWDAQVPADDPDSWRSPEVWAAYRSAALAADPTSGSRRPPSFRNPTGPLVDAFYLAQGRQLYDASLIRARLLVVRSGADFWSRPEDAERLVAHAPAGRLVTIPEALHYVHLDLATRGRARLLAEVLGFLGEG
jgi:pimeloyl-ACP methyl ester carboxylesterase